jgi:hypothetical protein
MDFVFKVGKDGSKEALIMELECFEPYPFFYEHT